MEAFQVYLLGRDFVVQTDHRSLMWLDRLKDKNMRLARWSLVLQQYSFKVLHQAGSKNGNADAFLRGPPHLSGVDQPQEKGKGMYRRA